MTASWTQASITSPSDHASTHTFNDLLGRNTGARINGTMGNERDVDIVRRRRLEWSIHCVSHNKLDFQVMQYTYKGAPMTVSQRMFVESRFEARVYSTTTTSLQSITSSFT